MTFGNSLRLIILHLLTIFASVQHLDAACVLRLSELELYSSVNASREFIELAANSSSQSECQRFDLTPYSVALWRSESKGKKITLHSVLSFAASDNLYCRKLNQSILVLGPQSLQQDLPKTADFCSLESLKWQPSGKHFIDEASGRVDALVLYKGVQPSEFKINQTLDAVSAHTDKVVDAMFYRGSSSGSGRSMYKFFMPNYNIGQPGKTDTYYILQNMDAGNVTENDKHSFTFCCPTGDQSVLKWPMGFKWALPSPGLPNSERCSDANALYILDKNGTTFPPRLDRCNVSALENYFPTTTRTPPLTTVAPRTKPWAMGLAIGLPLTLVLVTALVGAVIYRRRSYRSVQDDGSGGGRCFYLRCLDRDADQDRLVLDT